ncbi:MAG: hypothetical protein AB1898_11000 [Acidobacteriota bacterium]
MRRYKEILFGLALGLAMWVIDAAMHVQIRPNEASWAGNFIRDFSSPGPAPLFFRVLFCALAVFLGLVLWRSNQRQRQAQDTEQKLRNLHRAMTSPVMLIVGYSKLLIGNRQLNPDSTTQFMVQVIHDSALKLQSLAEKSSLAEPEAVATIATPARTRLDKAKGLSGGSSSDPIRSVAESLTLR